MYILIFDDNTIVGEGVASLVMKNIPAHVEEVLSDDLEILPIVKKSIINLVVLGFESLSEKRIGILREILDKHSSTKILLFNRSESYIHFKQLFNMQVAGLIGKETSTKELIEAIYKINNGETFYGASISKLLVSQNMTPYPIRLKSVNISDREKEVLKYIIDGLSTKEICSKLFVSKHTINSHRKNLLRKFDVKNAAGMIKRAIEANML